MLNLPNRHSLALVTPLLVLLSTACRGDTRELDPYVSTENPRETLTELDYGNLDSAEIRLNLPWSRNRVSRDATPDTPTAALNAVTTESFDGYDRVIFTFDERYPGYELEYATEGGGGCDGDVPAGDAPAHLVVAFAGARSNDGGTPLVEDSERSLDFPTLIGATQACDENGRVKWILAAAADAEYRILETLGTPRLVVDLKHP